MRNLLARFAANAFWTGRYMERAENLARILDVNETFARGGTEEESWLPIVRLHADEDLFFSRHKRAAADRVAHFYTIDRDNPSSIIASIIHARENARTMRHVISTEMWMQLNVFHGWITELNRRDIRLNNLSRVCATIKESCQTHAGIVQGTLYRDQVWYFYLLGKHLERAGQTSRLVDIKSHLLENPIGEAEVAADISQWNALLRSAAGYHAFRRVHPRGIEPDRVIEFFFFNGGFPRSVISCLDRVDTLLAGLAKANLVAAQDLRDNMTPLQDLIHGGNVQEVRRLGLNAFIDDLQRELDSFSSELGERFFQ